MNGVLVAVGTFLVLSGLLVVTKLVTVDLRRMTPVQAALWAVILVICGLIGVSLLIEGVTGFE